MPARLRYAGINLMNDPIRSTTATETAHKPTHRSERSGSTGSTSNQSPNRTQSEPIIGAQASGMAAVLVKRHSNEGRNQIVATGVLIQRQPSTRYGEQVSDPRRCPAPRNEDVNRRSQSLAFTRFRLAETEQSERADPNHAQPIHTYRAPTSQLG